LITRKNYVQKKNGRLATSSLHSRIETKRRNRVEQELGVLLFMLFFSTLSVGKKMLMCVW